MTAFISRQKGRFTFIHVYANILTSVNKKVIIADPLNMYDLIDLNRILYMNKATHDISYATVITSM